MSAPAAQHAVDLQRLESWMREALPRAGRETGPIRCATRITGGTQNVLVRIACDSADYVFRSPAADASQAIHDSFRREARLLEALSPTSVPHARLVASCDDESVLGAPFYLMEPVEGFTATPLPLPEPYAGNPEWRHRMGLSMVEALARLGEVDHLWIGLGDFGKPDGFLERQAPRWLQHLERCREQPGWPGPGALPDVHRIAAWLAARIPGDYTPGILHGDFHFGNVMFDPQQPEVAAIVDWELATIGDPLLDLGWLIATWPDSSDVAGRGAGTIQVRPASGLPTPRELVAHYAKHSKRDVASIDWYVMLARFKLGIMLEASYARSCAGKASKEVGARHHASALQLLEQASAAIDHAAA